MKLRSLLKWAALLVLVGVVSARAALRLCPACGYEAGETETVCAHCGAPLPPADSAAPVPAMPPEPETPAAAKPVPPAAEIPDGLITEQARTAHGYAERDAWWGAMLFARNAQALLGLRGAEGARQRAELAGLIAQAHARIAASSVECPACEGTGKQKMITLSLSGESNIIEVAGGRCPVCHGLGRLNSFISAEDLARQEGEALRAFKLEQQKRGLEEFRGIWLPYGVATNLTVRQIADLRHAFGTPCEACHGLGSIGCETCDGAGVEACPKKCVQGWLVCPDCGGKGRRSRTSSSGLSSSSSSSSSSVMARCETCNGVGKIRCPECHGAGVVPCEKCDGAGHTACKVCKGRGEAPVCTQCQGTGVEVCRRCNGTGEYRGKPCEECNGQGVKLCTRCQGSGAVPRVR